MRFVNEVQFEALEKSGTPVQDPGVGADLQKRMTMYFPSTQIPLKRYDLFVLCCCFYVHIYIYRYIYIDIHRYLHIIHTQGINDYIYK